MTVLANGKQNGVVKEESLCLVKNTTSKVVNLYGQAKNFSPTLCKGLDMVECRVPKEWVESLGAASGPMIDGLDNRIDMITKTVNDRVISPVKSRLIPVGSLKKAVSMPDVRELSKIAEKKLGASFEHVKEFSAGRGKELLTFDMVEYCSQVVDNASTVAQPYRETIHDKLAVAVAKAQDSLAKFQESVSARSAKTVEQIEATRKELQFRLSELSAASIAYVQAKYSTLHSMIPEGYQPEQLYSKLPAQVQGSVEIILNSPALLTQVKDKANISREKSVVQNLNCLLAAVKDVYVPQLKTLTAPKND